MNFYDLHGKPVEHSGRIVMVGTLYMDHGEGWDKVESQLSHFQSVKGKIAYVLFRVVCKSTQFTRAKDMLARIDSAINDMIPPGTPMDMGITVYQKKMGTLYLGMPKDVAEVHMRHVQEYLKTVEG